MPRPTRTRTSLPGHSKSAVPVKTISTPDAIDDSYMMDPTEMAPIQAPRFIQSESSTNATEITMDEPTTLNLKPQSHEPSLPRMTKAEKAQAKRQNLLDQINQRSQPYSKSHNRRLKRSQRPSANLVTSLSDFQDVLPSIEPEFEEPSGEGEDEGIVIEDEEEYKLKDGKGREKLTAKKRQRVLSSESTRLPAILANSNFSQSPFATIRMHTLNTMAAQKAAASTGSGGASKKKKGGK
ncbi:hypothetical protein JCM5353_002054 [Sporobolomyces roseus]